MWYQAIFFFGVLSFHFSFSTLNFFIIFFSLLSVVLVILYIILLFIRSVDNFGEWERIFLDGFGKFDLGSSWLLHNFASNAIFSSFKVPIIIFQLLLLQIMFLKMDIAQYSYLKIHFHFRGKHHTNRHSRPITDQWWQRIAHLLFIGKSWYATLGGVSGIKNGANGFASYFFFKYVMVLSVIAAWGVYIMLFISPQFNIFLMGTYSSKAFGIYLIQFYELFFVYSFLYYLSSFLCS